MMNEVSEIAVIINYIENKIKYGSMAIDRIGRELVDCDESRIIVKRKEVYGIRARKRALEDVKSELEKINNLGLNKYLKDIEKKKLAHTKFMKSLETIK